jgi:hypothetical protein
MVPNSAPLSDEFYYVLLAAWDSAGSYDQIGFSNSYGTWGLTYSWTSGPPSNPTYHYSANAMALSVGATYTFIITTESGVTHFRAYQSSTQVWSLDASTGGNNLIIAGTYSGYHDYTDYEEIWYTHSSGGSPAFDFYFYDNYWVPLGGGKNDATWTTFSSAAPSNVATIIDGNTVLVDNPLGGAWGAWTQINGKLLARTSPAAYSSGGQTGVFVTGTNNRLYWSADGSANWVDLGGVLTSSPSATSPASGAIDVFVRGSDSYLYERSYV